MIILLLIKNIPEKIIKKQFDPQVFVFVLDYHQSLFKKIR